MRTDPNALATFAAVAAYVKTLPPGGKLLDVGCGDGQLLGLIATADARWQLAGCGWEVGVPTGVEKFSGINLNETGWAGRIPGGRDVIVATDVIEHLLNPCGLLHELRGLISDEGRLILTFPNVHNLRSRLAFAISGRFSGFFGPNFNDQHPIYDQHLWVPNLHLLNYFLSLTGWAEVSRSPVFGRTLLTSQTTLFVARPSGRSRL